MPLVRTQYPPEASLTDSATKKINGFKLNETQKTFSNLKARFDYSITGIFSNTIELWTDQITAFSEYSYSSFTCS